MSTFGRPLFPECHGPLEVLGARHPVSDNGFDAVLAQFKARMNTAD